MEHLLHVLGLGGSCGEHMLWPWLAAGGAVTTTAAVRQRLLRAFQTKAQTSPRHRQTPPRSN